MPGIPAKINVTPDIPIEPQPVPKAPEQPKDWTLPGPSTKVVETPTPPESTPGGAVGGTGTAAKTGGSGEGSDDGVPGGTGHGGTPLKELPRLLNRDEVLAGMKRLYPESERQAGREGAVVIMIHLGVDGLVSSSDIARAASPAFDAAAKKVGALMRFSPAIGLNGKPVRCVPRKSASVDRLADPERNLKTTVGSGSRRALAFGRPTSSADLLHGLARAGFARRRGRARGGRR